MVRMVNVLLDLQNKLLVKSNKVFSTAVDKINLSKTGEVVFTIHIKIVKGTA